MVPLKYTVAKEAISGWSIFIPSDWIDVEQGEEKQRVLSNAL